MRDAAAALRQFPQSFQPAVSRLKGEIDQRFPGLCDRPEAQDAPALQAEAAFGTLQKDVHYLLKKQNALIRDRAPEGNRAQ